MESQTPGDTGTVPNNTWRVNSTCIGVDVCGGGHPFCFAQTALIGKKNESNLAEVKKQPEDQQELASMVAAKSSCPVNAIRPPDNYTNIDE